MARLVVVSRGLSGVTVQEPEKQLPITRDIVRRCLELRLLREEEDETTGLTGI